MASLSRSLLLQSRRCPAAIVPRRAAAPTRFASHRRPLSTTPARRAEDAKDGSATAAAAKAPAEILADATTSPVPEDETAAQLRRLVADLSALDPEVVDDAIRKGKQGIPFAQDFNLERDEDFELEEDDRRRTMTGFWAEGEASMGPDEDYHGDDITSHGHGQLQQHRELREYARLIAWELPLLSRTSPASPPLPFQHNICLTQRRTMT
jgi:small subunit ribosomal protein S35